VGSPIEGSNLPDDRTHAAGLITCLTLLKDYNNTPQLKGVGLFVGLFGMGLIAAMTAFIELIGSDWFS
jgi:hypothetical protein